VKRSALILLLTFQLAGCASSPKPAPVPYSETLARRLSAAVELSEKGEVGEATDLLTAICEEPGVVGVTDEALLRLALLRLGVDATGDEPSPARAILERLQREYPSSRWAREAESVLGLLDSRLEVLRANQDLKTANNALRNENAALVRKRDELQKRLDELKDLDLKLEEKSRR